MILTFLIITVTFLTCFLTNFNSSVEFSICSWIPFVEGLVKGLNDFCVVGFFSGSYCQADCHFNYNTNVKVTVEQLHE